MNLWQRLRWAFSSAETRMASDTWEAGWGRSGSDGAATGLVPFFAAIRHIVDFMSTLPVDGYRVESDMRIPMTLPRLLSRLNDPGDEGLGTWVGKWAYGLAVHGNSVGWISATDGFGFPLAVRWLNRADWSFDEYRKQWYVFQGPVPATQIVHCAWVVPPGMTIGMSPLEHFREFWAAGLSAQEYADIGRGGGIPPAHLRNNALVLDDEQSRRVQAKAVASFASGKPFVTGKDWELDLKAIPPNQIQFLQTLQLTANQTAAIFGIDPREIGGNATESLTYATDESRQLNRANNLRPYLVRFEEMVGRILPERQFIKLNVDATMRTDARTRTEIIGMKLADGRLNLDEARALEDQPPLPNGQGQRYNVPVPTQDRVNREGVTS